MECPFSALRSNLPPIISKRMQNLDEILKPNGVFAVARRRWGYDHDLWQGSSVSEALKTGKPKVFSVEIPIYSSRVTIYQNTDANTLSAHLDDYQNGDDNKQTLVDNDSIADKNSMYKGVDIEEKSILEEDDNQPIFDSGGKYAISTSYRSKYMRSRYTTEIIGYNKTIN